MKRERVEVLLDSYGARPEAWPAGEREEALALIAGDGELREALREATRLDRLLDADEVVLPDLSRRILPALPESRLARFLAWLFPGDGAAVYRPVLAGCLPLVLGIGLGLGGTADTPEADGSWAAHEQALMVSSYGDDWYE
jgi:hypothetical protein